MTAKKKPIGRPRTKIDWELLDDLCSIQCTLAECCQVLKISEPTLEARMKDQYGMTFAEYFKTKRVLGKVALRRTLWRMSERHPNVAMFMSKQPSLLGYSERSETTITTPPSEVEALPDAELLEMLGLSKDQIQFYMNKMTPLEQEAFLIARNASNEG